MTAPNLTVTPADRLPLPTDAVLAGTADVAGTYPVAFPRSAAKLLTQGAGMYGFPVVDPDTLQVAVDWRQVYTVHVGPLTGFTNVVIARFESATERDQWYRDHAAEWIG